MTSLSLPDSFAEGMQRVKRDEVVGRIWRHDHTVWQSDPTEITEPSRLGWLNVIDTMRAQVENLSSFALEAKQAGLDRAVLMGMGGSSLAPELLARYFGPGEKALDLEVLDTTDPATIAALTSRLDLESTLFIVSSKSGGTLETLSHFSYFWQLLPDGSHFVAITDEGTPLAKLGVERKFRRVFQNPSDIGGRYSALSFFGLVPAVLLGVDIESLLREAAAVRDSCRPEVPPDENPGAQLGVFLGQNVAAGRDKLSLAFPPEQESLGDWVEQLIAESTGKNGTGILPVIGEADALQHLGKDRAFVTLGPQAKDVADLEAARQPVLNLPKTRPIQVGGEFFLWEFATSVASYFLGINPFDQPDVQAAKDATGRILASKGSKTEITTPGAEEVLETTAPGDYIALLAYLTRTAATEARLQGLRATLGRRFQVPTTLGFGPRYLHSTGQMHKGGPRSGVFLVLTGGAEEDIEIPGQDFSFGQLRQAQALGDVQSLQGRHSRVARLDLGENPAAKLEELRESVG